MVSAVFIFSSTVALRVLSVVLTVDILSTVELNRSSIVAVNSSILVVTVALILASMSLRKISTLLIEHWVQASQVLPWTVVMKTAKKTIATWIVLAIIIN